MTGVELKLYLKDNPYLISDLLESVGCNNVVVKHDRITCCNPDGDNLGAVNVMLNDTLNCTNYTRPDYQIKYEIRDIITLIQFFLDDISLNESIKYIKDICKIEGNGESKRSSTLSKLRKLKNGIRKEFSCNDTVLDEKELDNYMDAYIKYKFLDDGISKYVQDEFQIRYDLYANRAIIPIRNSNGELVTLKGRSLYRDNELEEKCISKYIYYYKFSGKYYLYGEYENRTYIEESDEIYVFEAEKSVHQAASFGMRNCVAISKHDISIQQVRKLAGYGKKIVIAFDKDVKLNDVINQCRKFKGVEVYYLFDTEGFLSHKMSPTDDGENTFKMLDNMCRFKFDYKEMI